MIVITRKRLMTAIKRYAVAVMEDASKGSFAPKDEYPRIEKELKDSLKEVELLVMLLTPYRTGRADPLRSKGNVL